MFKRIIAIALTLILSTSVFSLMPQSFALETANLTVIEGTSATSKTWAEKIAMLKADSEYAGTTLQVSDIYENKENLIGNEVNLKDINVNNRATSVIISDSTDKVIKEFRSDSLVKLTDGNIYDYSTALEGTTVDTYEMVSPTGTGSSYSDNMQNGTFDAKVTVSLSSSTEISKLYSFYHPGTHLSWCAYEIYVGEDYGTLYSANNKVASFDYMRGYYNTPNGSPEFSLNGASEAENAHRRSEGQIWSFNGENKPQGSYVGYKIIFAEAGDRARLDLFDLGVFGNQNLKILDGVENVTEEGWSNKKSYLAVGSNYPESTLQVSDIYSYAQDTPTAADTVLEDIVGVDSKNNKIASIKVTDYANNVNFYSQSVNYNVYNGEGFYGATDGNIYQGPNHIGTYISSGLAITNAPGSYKDHVLNDTWDAKVTLKLSEKTSIDKIYSSQHPNAELSWQVYQVYVADNEAALYNNENLVAWYDYYYGYYGFSVGGFLGRHLNGNNVGGDQNRRAETQIWSFAGEQKPEGKYVGFKIIYGEHNRTRLDLADVCVTGSVASEIHNGRDMKVKSSVMDTAIYDDSVQYQETAFVYSDTNEYKMLYPIDEIINVRSYDLKTLYEENVDYIVEDGVLKLTENTTIPIYQHSDEDDKDLLSLNSQNVWDRTSYWATRQWRFQINVSYTHSKTWDDDAYYVNKPASELCDISTFVKKAESGEETNIVFIGDSIATGCDASGMDETAYLWNSDNDASTLQLTHFDRLTNLDLSVIPEWSYIGWPKQVANELVARYGENVKYNMRAIGSSRAEWAARPQNMKFLYGEGEGTSNLPTPDLAFIAYGMNENLNSKETQKEYTAKIIDFLRERNPECSIVLVSAFVPNFHFTDNLDRHEQGFYELADEYDNIIVAPVNKMFQSMLSVKTKYDYTSNLVNHPNDFGANVYADVVLSVMDADVEHKYNILKFNETEHWNECVCGAEGIGSRKEHTGGTATCKDLAVCDTCNIAYGDIKADNHKYTNYVYNNDATCQKDGTKTAVCDYGCGGTDTITAIGTKKAHTYGANYVSSNATFTSDGVISKKCACGNIQKVGAINKIKSVSIAYASTSYTGKALKPKVTVKDSAGKTVTSYKVVYSNNTKVGKATAKITFTGNYSGTKTLTFKIVPKKTSISSLKAGKKSLTVKYNKQTSGTGYEIQYSTSSKFKSAKTVKISKNKTVSKTIKKLKSKKTYYVRVRVTKGSSYKSSWSSVKKIKVK